MFSTRIPADLTPNRLTAALADLRVRGVPLVDLTETNPTRVGLSYPADLLAPLAAPAGLRYDPHPFGLASAREAVAAECRAGGLAVDPSRIALTASTSDAYSYLFKLLCDAGDHVLVPVPSYPLFEHLTRLDLVGVRTYPLDYHGRWAIDVSALEAAMTDRTRAVLVVSPNNPTGSVIGRDELAALAALCAARGLALIGDEVFADYPIDPRSDWARVGSQHEALAFTLGGLSKSAGLPQLKLGWMAVSGPATLVNAALARLEIICDAHLAVSTPVQLAAGALIESGRHVRALILDRVRQNLSWLADAVARHSACTLLPVEGGWSAIVRVPATRSEESLVVELLERDHVLVHPGYFFDFPREAYIVVSLLPEAEVFREGAARLLARASS